MPAFMSLRELRTIAGDPNVGVLNKVKRFDGMCKSPWSAYRGQDANRSTSDGARHRVLISRGPQLSRGV